MPRKIKVFLIILIVVLGIFLLMFFLGGRDKAPKQSSTPIVTTEATATESKAPSAPKRSSEELEELSAGNQILAIARSFAERYGSFSNHGGFENLLDLEPIVTTSLWGELQDLHKSGQSEPDNEYYGVSTRALSVKLLKLDSNISAKVSAQTQREEARGSLTNKRVYYQELRMDLVYSDGDWKVDYAKWQ